MNLKKLTQAVFEGLPSEYRWAAVYPDGLAIACTVDMDNAVDKQLYDLGHVWAKIGIGSTHGLGSGWDATDWQNSLIERLDVPTKADIDWSRQDVPAGATHYAQSKTMPYKYHKKIGDKWAFWAAKDGWVAYSSGEHEQVEFQLANAIKRPESITDAARSIEAARVAEQSERTYPHYFKDVSAVDAIDLYHVARLYDITDPALFHAFKKIACAGKRGAKDQAQDVQEAIDALKRWQELSK